MNNRDLVRVLVHAHPGKQWDMPGDCESVNDERFRWLEQDAKPTQASLDTALAVLNSVDGQAAVHVDKQDRLLFEINFDQENRIRVLEGRAAITRAQYRNALINAWKTLP
jgi:hypothetical protein